MKTSLLQKIVMTNGFLYIFIMFSAEFSMLCKARLKHGLHLHFCQTAGTHTREHRQPSSMVCLDPNP